MPLLVLAEKIGCSYGTIHRIEKGKATFIKPALLKKISQVLDVNYDELLSLSGYNLSPDTIAEDDPQDAFVEVPILSWKQVQDSPRFGLKVPVDLSKKTVKISNEEGTYFALSVPSLPSNAICRVGDDLILRVDHKKPAHGDVLVYSDSGKIQLINVMMIQDKLCYFDEFAKSGSMALFKGKVVQKQIIGKVVELRRGF